MRLGDGEMGVGAGVPGTELLAIPGNDYTRAITGISKSAQQSKTRPMYPGGGGLGGQVPVPGMKKEI
jgi:hypothetical protein